MSPSLWKSLPRTRSVGDISLTLLREPVGAHDPDAFCSAIMAGDAHVLWVIEDSYDFFVEQDFATDKCAPHICVTEDMAINLLLKVWMIIFLPSS